MGLSGLPWLFTAVQMHLHWGSGGPSHGGSEHAINGLSAEAEVRSNTAETSRAPSKSGRTWLSYTATMENTFQLVVGHQRIEEKVEIFPVSLWFVGITKVYSLFIPASVHLSVRIPHSRVAAEARLNFWKETVTGVSSRRRPGLNFGRR